MPAAFSISKISIIESLEPSEVHTGRIIAEYIRAQLESAGIDLQVEVLECESKIEFLAILERLAQEAIEVEHIPLLHIECHGDKLDGLEFANSSMMSWPELSDELLKLNCATRFNLFSVISACSGGYFLSQIFPGQPAPCLGMLAPSDAVDPAEILEGFRIFYSTFIKTFDAGSAAQKMSRQRLTAGKWFVQSSDEWFVRIVINYVQVHCTRKQLEERAKKLSRKLRNSGIEQSIGLTKRRIRKDHNSGLVDKYFASFFMTERFPENKLRFNNSSLQAQAHVASILTQRPYRL